MFHIMADSDANLVSMAETTVGTNALLVTRITTV